MTDAEKIHREMQDEYEGRWAAGDPWEADATAMVFHRRKVARQLGLLAGRRYGRTLEIACGNGNLTGGLADLSDGLVSLDIAASAVARARAAVGDRPHVRFLVANIIDQEYEPGEWDLVTFVEAIYSLGHLYPFFDVAWRAHSLYEAVAPGGRLLLTNTLGGPHDYLLHPYIIRTYRDLFRNVGFAVEHEEVLMPEHPDLLPVEITLFGKPL